MFDFYEKRRIKTLLFSKLSIFVLVALTTLLALSVYDRYRMEREVSERRSEREAEYRELANRAAELEAKIAYLESEKGIEEELRDRYGVVKEGEQAVVILDNATAESVESAPAPRESWFTKVFFFWR